jgi:hypothetical protein
VAPFSGWDSFSTRLLDAARAAGLSGRLAHLTATGGTATRPRQRPAYVPDHHNLRSNLRCPGLTWDGHRVVIFGFLLRRLPKLQWGGP